MKVCFWGNQDNNAYRLCKWLRVKGIDAHLYMMKKASPLRSLPELIDKELESAYPDWIHIYDNTGYRVLYVPKKLRKEIQDNYDIIVGSYTLGFGHTSIFDLPVIFLSLGTAKNALNIPSEVKNLLKTPQESLKKIIRRFNSIRSLKKCQKILVGQEPIISQLCHLGLSSKQVIWASPEDVAGNKKLVNSDLLKQLNDQYGRYDKVFLSLSRVNFVEKRSAEYKGTEKFLAAFEKLVTDKHYNIKVIMGEHGHDWQLLKRDIEGEKLSQYFDFVPHLPYWKLLTYLRIDNAVVFDQFTTLSSASSGMLREAFSVGAIVVRSHNEHLTSLGHGPNCPVLKAVTTEDIYKRMREVLAWDETQIKQKKAEINKWAMEYLHWEKHIDRFISILTEVSYIREVADRSKEIR